ncbi:hypothetical protein LOZ53_003137 [Ophidiomyces ophidiicola]|nr:hypothetical protein LOZ53_003137 [Ophidiomyces ophidiicola]KAI1999264.1 hypothetical protein LOZ51_001751 [Ophidiomyces ophidiicola]
MERPQKYVTKSTPGDDGLDQKKRRLILPGAKCGSTTIDREFYKLMSKRFGDAFDRLPLKLKGPGSEFMNAFERIKQDFGYSTVGDEIYELPLDMSTEDALPKYFDEDERLVKISQQDVCNLFDPVVERVKALVLQQIGAANLDAAEDVINKIILVGGFGDSEYLRKALKQHFTATSDIQLIVPQYPQAAIVKGAVLRGLEGVRPTTRRCRRHYGFCYVARFRKGVDDEAKATFCEFYGTKFGPPRMNWMIEKGEKVLENTCQRVELYRSSTVPFTKISTCLYSCSLDDAPQDPSHQRVNIVGNIVSDVSNISSPFIESKINQNGVRVYALHFEIEMHFGAKEGVLKFKTVVGGNVVGEAEIDFSKN